ncbi:MAG: hypothetical protein ACOC1K_06910 [Nanoarchaeota archaeon]
MKKGEIAREFLGRLIIIMLVLSIVLVFVNKWQDATNDAARATNCKASVKANAALHLKGVELSKRINEVNCPTQEIVIEKKTEDEEIKRIIADSMAECWDMYGEGKLELFGDEGIYCAVCSYIEFEEKDKEIEGFYEYLQKQKMSNSKLTYQEFLQGYETEIIKEDLENLDTSEFDNLADTTTLSTNQNLSTIFLYAKGEKYYKQVYERLMTPSGAMTVGMGSVSLVSGGIAAGLAIIGSGGSILVLATGAAIISGIVAVGSAVYNYFFTDGVNAQWMSFVVLKEYNQNELEKLGCTYAPAKQES